MRDIVVGVEDILSEKFANRISSSMSPPCDSGSADLGRAATRRVVLRD